MKTKIMITMTLAGILGSFAAHAEDIHFVAGSINEKGSEKHLGLVCQDKMTTNMSECQSLSFAVLRGQFPLSQGEAMATKEFLSKLDVAEANFVKAKELKDSDAKKFKSDIEIMIGSSSEPREVSSQEYAWADAFTANFKSYVLNVVSSAVTDGGKAIYVKCADEKCTTVNFVYSENGRENVIKNVTQDKLLKLAPGGRKPMHYYGGAKAVFGAIGDITHGKSGSGGMYGWGNDGHAISPLGLSFISGGAYPAAYGVAVTAAATAGVLTFVVETPVSIGKVIVAGARGLFKPRVNGKINDFIKGEPVKMSTDDFQQLYNSILALQ